MACQAVCRVLGAALPALGLLLGRQHGLALHCAWPSILASVTTRGRLGAQPCIARPTIPLPVFRPHSRSTFSCPPPFFVRWKIWVFFLVSFLFPSLFLFLGQREKPGKGASWRALECPGAAAIRRPAAGTVRRGLPVSLSGPRVPCWLSPGVCPSVPSLLAQSSARLSPAPAARSLLLAVAEPWKPPRLNAAPADVTAACDQSAPRGPSVNHTASPPAGEKAGRPRLEDQWRRARAVPATSSETSWPFPGLVRRPFRHQGLTVGGRKRGKSQSSGWG